MLMLRSWTTWVEANDSTGIHLPKEDLENVKNLRCKSKIHYLWVDSCHLGAQSKSRLTRAWHFGLQPWSLCSDGESAHGLAYFYLCHVSHFQPEKCSTFMRQRIMSFNRHEWRLWLRSSSRTFQQSVQPLVPAQLSMSGPSPLHRAG